MKNKTFFSAVTAVATSLAIQSISSAAFFVDFTPVTQDTNLTYAGATPDARSLSVSSPLVTLRSGIGVPALAAPIVNGYEVFAQTTFSLSGLTTFGAATSGATITQSVTVGTFTFTSSPTYGSVVLLTGVFQQLDGDGDPANTITGPKNGTVGSTFASTVSYTGGAIYAALLALPGAVPVGDAVFNLLLVQPSLSTETYLGQKYLTAFDARAQGQFSTPVVPETTSVAFMSAAGSLVMLRRRR